MYLDLELSNYYLNPFISSPGIYCLEDDQPGQYFNFQSVCLVLDSINKIGKLQNGSYIHYET